MNNTEKLFDAMQKVADTEKQRLREEGFKDGAQLADIIYSIHYQYISLVKAYEVRREFPVEFLEGVLKES